MTIYLVLFWVCIFIRCVIFGYVMSNFWYCFRYVWPYTLYCCGCVSSYLCDVFGMNCQISGITLYPYSAKATNPQNPQETINVRIRLDSWRIVKFSTHSVMFCDPDMKQVRNSYEYSRDLAGVPP